MNLIFKTLIIIASAQAHSDGLNEADRSILYTYYKAANAVFESGIGESTLIAASAGVQRYTGVETSIEWISKIRERVPEYYRFHLADIGTTVAWGYPASEHTKFKWPLASSAALEAEEFKFDVYFIDGRFRVASFARALMHGDVVGIHDMRTRNNTQYKDIHTVAYPITGFGVDNSGASLTFFRRKKTTTDEDLIILWNRYKLNPE